ncbi:MAG: YD repeat-containing protein [Flammeovirgaceae bacterium]|jgi:YD repeat-containing protein
MKKFALLLVLVFGVGVSWGQSDPLSLPNIVPPSPETASLLDFNNAKANEYSGGISMSIPIYTISKGSIQLPISLGYQSSGTQVDKIASRVGMDWSLNAGGAIARSIIGGADEYLNGYFSDRIDTLLIFMRDDGLVDYYFNCQLFNSLTPSTHPARKRFKLMSELASGKADSQPDIYSYSLPNGVSGKFIFNKDKQIQSLGKNNIKIVNPFQRTEISPKKWEVTDEQGVTYSFEYTEIMYGGTSCGESDTPYNFEVDPNLFTAWHLTRMISPDLKDTVTLEYYGEEQIYDLSYNEKRYLYTLGSPSEDTPRRENSYCTQYAVSLTPVIKSIKTNWGISVDFLRGSTQRLDLEGSAYPLKEIIVYHNNIKIKQVRLATSYFQAKTENAIVDDNDSKNYRLRLDGVWQIGNNSKILPTHTFNYIDNGNFPKRLNCNQDYWGYYNGMSNDRLTGFSPAYDHELEGIIGANRFPNVLYAQEGMLSSIEYPNGGKTTYLYEGNEVPNPHEQGFHKAKEKIKKSEYLFLDVEGETSREFIVESPMGTGYVLADFLNGYEESSSNDEDAVSIIVDDESQYSLSYLEMSISGNGIEPIYFLPNAVKQKIIYLPNGTYTAKIKILDSSRVPQQCRLNLQWYAYGDILENINVGGVRVATEKKNSGAGVLVYRYKYLQDQSLESSGKQFRNLKYSYDESTQRTTGTNCFGRGKFGINVYSSSYLKPFGLMEGSHIGYSRVERISINNEGEIGGKKVSKYLNERETRGVFGSKNRQIERLGNTYFDNTFLGFPANGLLLKEDYYAVRYLSQVPNYTLKSTREFIYEEKGRPLTSYHIKVKKYQTANCQTCEFVQFETGFYWHTTESLFKLTKEKNSIFTDDGKVLTTEKEYTYDISNGYLSNVFSKGSEGILNDPIRGQNYTALNSQSVRYKYPKDFASVGNVYQEMLDKNILSVPVEIETRSAGAINIQKTNYQIIGENILPESINTKHGDNPEETRIQYHAYDLNGNPLEFSKTDDIRTSILWDANRLRPIAKAVNASHNQIWHTSFEEDGDAIDGGWTGNKSKENPILDIPNLPVGQYLFSYWQEDVEGIWNLVEENLSNTEIATKTLTGKVDEIRIHPIDAQMSTITYDEAGRTLTKCDANGHTVCYHYDGFGRLQHIKDEWGNIVKVFDYKYSIEE